MIIKKKKKSIVYYTKQKNQTLGLADNSYIE